MRKRGRGRGRERKRSLSRTCEWKRDIEKKNGMLRHWNNILLSTKTKNICFNRLSFRFHSLWNDIALFIYFSSHLEFICARTMVLNMVTHIILSFAKMIDRFYRWNRTSILYMIYMTKEYAFIDVLPQLLHANWFNCIHAIRKIHSKMFVWQMNCSNSKAFSNWLNLLK